MKEIFYELIKEAKEGKVIIDGEEWPYSFNTIIRENDNNKLIYFDELNISTLIIEDEENFFNKLSEYIELELNKDRPSMKIYQKDNPLKQRIKLLIANLFANATTEDFIDPIPFIEKNISFLNDKSFSILDIPIEVQLSKNFKNSTLEVSRETNNTMMETPYRIDFKFCEKEGKGECYLPSIYYGVEEKNGIKTCYIYGIQNKNKISNSLDETYQKKINRILYKINSGISDYETNDYFEFKENNDLPYPEGNITDVSVSFVLALNIFISLLQAYKIENLKAVTFLPLRYLSREIAANEKNSEELYERNQNIQNNLTNKFIRTFRRLAIQNNSLEVLAYPYEIDEYLTMKVKPKTKELDNIILEETSLNSEETKKNRSIA